MKEIDEIEQINIEIARLMVNMTNEQYNDAMNIVDRVLLEDNVYADDLARAVGILKKVLVIHVREHGEEWKRKRWRVK